MFEDHTGAELVFLQAQKDLWKLVKNDELEETRNDRQAQVGGESEHDVGKVDSTVVGKTHEVSVGSTKVQKVDKQITLTVGESTIVLDGPNITVTAKDQIMFKAVGILSIQGGDNVYLNCKDTCADLWDQYKKEAENVIAKAGDDVRERNKIISGAYADLYMKNPKLKWAGLAAYASKQVGCGMDHAKKMSAIGRAAGSLPIAGAMTEASAQYTLEMLGKGNKELFLDIYPLHRFFQEQGWDKFEQCAKEIDPATNKPRVPEWAEKGFEAVKNGDSDKHVELIADHEQINVLQKSIYSDNTMKAILWANQKPLNMNVPGMGQVGTSPAELVLGSGCTGDAKSPSTKFQGNKLYDVDQRMDWILDDAAPKYKALEGTEKHLGDLHYHPQSGRPSGRSVSVTDARAQDQEEVPLLVAAPGMTFEAVSAASTTALDVPKDPLGKWRAQPEGPHLFKLGHPSLALEVGPGLFSLVEAVKGEAYRVRTTPHIAYLSLVEALALVDALNQTLLAAGWEARLEPNPDRISWGLGKTPEVRAGM